MSETASEVEITIKMSENEEIGEIACDEETPTFETFKFKAFHDKYVTPGSLVSVKVGKNDFLIGRVISSHESNPHFTADKIAVRHSMGIIPDHPAEKFSITVFRTYEVEIVDQVSIFDGEYSIYPSESLPKAGSKVFVPDKRMISEVLGIVETKENGLYLGNLSTSISSESEIPVVLKKDIVQRHIFIGGTTGGGKSYAAKVLAEEIHKHKLPIIFFDTQEEFVPLTEKLNGMVLSPGSNFFIKLPSLTEDELLDLVPSVHHTLHLDVLSSAFIRAREANHNFTLPNLITAIEEVCTEQNTPKTTAPIITQRVQSYINSYDFIGNNFDWSSVLKNKNIIDINCKGVSRHRLQLILASTMRELQTLRKDKKIPPYIMFIDEAHLFVPEGEESSCKQIIRESVRMGRHNGICMVLITQSPIDIDKKAIRQCNTRLLFAIEPDQLMALQGVKADATQDMINRLPKSPVGTCIVSGTYETIKHALPLKIRQMKTQEADAGKAPPIFEEVKKLYK